jgi:hypothetical protein|tara:strand:+ start:22504 stop:22722 length:219 start_codon:yes stop_codon:yes gene_type:complete
MSDQKRKPEFRIMCARVLGRDRNDKEELGRFCQIGAVWAPSENGKWLPAPLDLTPQELANGEARLFLAPVED